MARGSEGKTLAYLAVLAVLVAVLAGLVYSKWDELKDQLFPTEPEVVREPAPVEPVKPIEPARPIEPVKPAEPAVPAAPAVDLAANARAEGFIAEGKGLLVAGNFLGAQNKFADVSELNCSAELTRLAMQLGAKVNIFDNLTADIAKNPEATGKLCLIKMVSGQEWEGVIDEKRSTTTHYMVQKNKGIGMPLPREQVESVTAVSAEEQERRLAARLGALEQELKPKSGVEYFQLAEFAWGNNLTAKAVDLLEKAYAADRDLKQSVVDDRAGRLLAKAIWRDAKNSSFWARKFCNQIVDKYPRSRHVASATELLASIDSRDRKKRAGLYKETVRISGGGEDISTSRVQRKIASPTQRAHEANMKVNIDATQGSAQVASILAQADRHFGSAMGHYQKGRPGMSGFNMHLQEAVRSFDKAMALYERAQKSEPNNRHIDNRMTDCQKYGYHARKMQTLGGF